MGRDKAGRVRRDGYDGTDTAGRNLRDGYFGTETLQRPARNIRTASTVPLQPSRFTRPASFVPLHRAALLTLASLTAGCGGARRTPEADPRPVPGSAATLRGGGAVLLPPRYDSGRRYPVLVMLPASNGTSLAMRNSYPSTGDVIVVLAAGIGTPSDVSGVNWMSTVARYERQLRADLAHLAERYRIDQERVILSGFSMGGDLAWALTLRNPELISGAIVMGSRMSYRGTAAQHATLARRRARFYVIVGDEEERTRVAGARAATQFLRSIEVGHWFREVDGLGHMRPEAAVFGAALEYLLR